MLGRQQQHHYLANHACVTTPLPACLPASRADVEGEAEMAAAEQRIMAALGWKGEGLITAVCSGDGLHDRGA